MINKTSRVLGAILLVSGTTIGAGMLALPVTTGLAGFIPALLLMTAIWLFMMLTAFYFLEVNLRIKEESNLISMTHKTLGKPGELVAWLIYLLLLYSLTAAYMVGCSQILSDFFDSLFHLDTPQWIWPILVFVIFSFLVYCGTGVVDFLNRFLMMGLFFAYTSIIVFGCCRLSPSFLAYFNWPSLFPSVSVVLTSFGYHIIIPTLATYLEHDVRLLKRAIFIGSLIPFLIYLFWQLLVMGVIPIQGEYSLTEAAHKGLQITFYLKIILENPWIGVGVRFFAFFAIVTSLLGVSLSLSDFLADGLHIKKTYRGNFFLILLTFAPPLLFALFYPEGFVLALQYAGICVVILLALLPALMVWFARYRCKELPESSMGLISPVFQVGGGKPVLIFTIIISLVILFIEVFA